MAEGTVAVVRHTAEEDMAEAEAEAAMDLPVVEDIVVAIAVVVVAPVIARTRLFLSRPRSRFTVIVYRGGK